LSDIAVTLLPTQILDGRSFTHPAHTQTDRAILGSILEILRSKMRLAQTLPAEPRPLVLHEKMDDDRMRRIVICNCDRLLSNERLTLVGFFGVRRDGVDRAPLDAVDEELIAGFGDYPGVLSYCSVQQHSGNWANLVVLADPSDLDHWSTSPRHAFAAKAMAPDYYLHIRLHNAALDGGLLSDNEIVLHRTKYYDFEEIPAWRAVREIAPPAEAGQ
jgi:hypothetical protein